MEHERHTMGKMPMMKHTPMAAQMKGQMRRGGMQMDSREQGKVQAIRRRMKKRRA